MRRWKKAAGEAPKRLGRPPHGPQVRERVKEELLKMIRFLGWAGWRVFDAVLDLPTRLIQAWLKFLKAEHRRRQRLREQRARKGVKVLYQGVLLGQDSTHVGNTDDGKSWAEVFKDPATLELQVAGDGLPLNAKSQVGHLEALKAEARLPLVHMTDNGSGNVNGLSEAWLKGNQVVHLRSLPHTPQHNGVTERGIGEAKQEGSFGKYRRLQEQRQGVGVFRAILRRISRRPRASRGWKTPQQLQAQLPHWSQRVTRQEFYSTTCDNIQTATVGLSGRAFRLARREAIFRTLEWFGLILRTKGGQQVQALKPDNIS